MQLVVPRIPIAIGLMGCGTRSDSHRAIVNPRLTTMLSMKRVVAAARSRSNSTRPGGHLLLTTARLCGSLTTSFFLFELLVRLVTMKKP